MDAFLTGRTLSLRPSRAHVESVTVCESSRPVRTAQDFVTWLDELTTALSPTERFGLVGLSYGAWLSAQYALARPERLSALALIAPAGTVMPLGLGFILRAVSCALPSPFFTRRFMTWLAHDLATKDAQSRAQLERRIEEGHLAMRSFNSPPERDMTSPSSRPSTPPPASCACSARVHRPGPENPRGFQNFSPRALISASTRSMPRLLMMRMPWVLTRSRTKRLRLGTQ